MSSFPADRGDAAPPVAFGLAWRWSDVDQVPWLTAMAVVLPPVAVAFARWGIPPLDAMWPMHRLGIVGPSCGLTRAVVALSRGEPGRAWQFNPAAFVVAAAVVTLAARALFAVVRGRWFEPVLRARRSGAVVVAATVALWANQQAHAQFLLHHLR